MEQDWQQYGDVVPLAPSIPVFNGNYLLPIGQLLDDTICQGWVRWTTSRQSFTEAAAGTLSYWRLSRHAIKMYENDQPLESASPRFETILMERISNVAQEPLTGDNLTCVFVIRMPGAIYYVGDNSTPENVENALQWMAQIRYWCIQSFQTDNVTFNIQDLYDVDQNRVLGFGQFGVVYSATVRQTGESVAIKAIDRHRAKQPHLRNETVINRFLQHPGIVKIFDVHLAIDGSDKIYIVSEKLHCDMLHFILSRPNKKLEERFAKFYAYQMICALAYLEFKRVAHCDLKPENILLVSDDPFAQIKLCDFGYSRSCFDLPKFSFLNIISSVLGVGSIYMGGSAIGTPQYMPPEANSKQGVRPTFDITVDTWSAGVIIYVFLTGIFPYNTNGDIIRQVSNDALIFSPQRWNPGISASARHLIREMLSLNTQRRTGVIRKARTHQWFTDAEHVGTYQLWSDLKVFEQRLADEALQKRGESMRSYWVSELCIDRKMEAIKERLNLPSWQVVGCQP